MERGQGVGGTFIKVAVEEDPKSYLNIMNLNLSSHMWIVAAIFESAG